MLGRVGDQTAAWLGDTLGPRIVSAARNGAPRRSGRLASDIRADVVGSGADATLRVGNTSAVPYSPFVHGGTGIRSKAEHWPPGTSLPMRPIRPIRAHRLSWVDGGQRIFAREVRGQHAQPYLQDALAEVLRGL